MKSSGSNSSSNGHGNGNGNNRSEMKIERKTIEKQRRMQMKALSLRLASLMPKPHSDNSTSTTQLDSLDEAAAYIITLRNRIQQLKDRKDTAANFTGAPRNYDSKINASINTESGFKLPIIEVRYQNPNLEVVLIINGTTSHNLTFHKLIRIIEEEGADVVNASHSTLGDKLVYTIHSQVRNPRSGLEASRISNRVKDWIYSQNM